MRLFDKLFLSAFLLVFVVRHHIAFVRYVACSFFNFFVLYSALDSYLISSGLSAGHIDVLHTFIGKTPFTYILQTLLVCKLIDVTGCAVQMRFILFYFASF